MNRGRGHRKAVPQAEARDAARGGPTREIYTRYYEKEVTAMNNKLVKWLGIGATAIGMGATLLSNWVSGKQEDEKIEKKVAEAVAKLTSKEG